MGRSDLNGRACALKGKEYELMALKRIETRQTEKRDDKSDFVFLHHLSRYMKRVEIEEERNLIFWRMNEYSF